MQPGEILGRALQFVVRVRDDPGGDRDQHEADDPLRGPPDARMALAYFGQPHCHSRLYGGPVRTDWISLLTDYGNYDGFVAACHGVIGRINPAARVVDITHDVPPGDIRRGAVVLAQTAPYLPPAVHVAVVDPGVGTARRAVAVQTPNGLLVGPDNGLL